MAYCKWFKQLSKASIPEAGGKGANLAEMFNSGFPVPPGFVVLAETYRKFLALRKIDKKIEEKLKDLDVEDNEKLQKVAIEVQKLIMSSSLPNDMQDEIKEFYTYVDAAEEIKNVKSAHALLQTTSREASFVAVRSSATAEDLPGASFAGQQATFVNTLGKEAVVNAVQKCWASLFNARAIYYRVKNNFPHMKVAIAVVVQKQINSDSSGVTFSINPSTNNLDQVVIEAIFGLGEAVVSGEVNPNTYIIDKKTGNIVEKDIPIQNFYLTRDVYTGQTIKRNLPKEKQKQQVLTEHQLRLLYKLALNVESHYGSPQDMEWAIEKNQIFLVQTRPVTTLKPQEKEHAAVNAESILKGLGASPGHATGTVKIVSNVGELDKVEKGDILVTVMTNPDYVPAMQRAVAIVTDEGGITAHAAIVSREMGIPAVVGTKTATKLLHDNDIITVDGSSGLVYKGEVQLTEIKPVSETIAKTRTKIKVIMDLPAFAQRAADTDADGIGLLRLEGIIASGKVHPAKYLRDGKLHNYEHVIYDGVKAIATHFKDKPVWIRTSDIRTDEYRDLEGGDLEPTEANPMIGWHGIRRSLAQPELLKAEFRALKRLVDEGFHNLGIMLPFVISHEEIMKAKELAIQVGLEPQKNIQFGIMVETPAAVLIIEELCQAGINFVSLGTNDLTQTILGVDRGNTNIADLYNEFHPAVLKAIELVVKTCAKYGIESSICGQAGSNPKMAEFLVRIGVDSISANADAVAEIRKIVAETEEKLKQTTQG
jgi:pyruvate,water dikinase